MAPQQLNILCKKSRIFWNHITNARRRISIKFDKTFEKINKIKTSLNEKPEREF